MLSDGRGYHAIEGSAEPSAAFSFVRSWPHVDGYTLTKVTHRPDSWPKAARIE